MSPESWFSHHWNHEIHISGIMIFNVPAPKPSCHFSVCAPVHPAAFYSLPAAAKRFLSLPVSLSLAQVSLPLFFAAYGRCLPLSGMPPLLLLQMNILSSSEVSADVSLLSLLFWMKNNRDFFKKQFAMNKIYHLLMYYFSIYFSYYLSEINGNNKDTLKWH